MATATVSIRMDEDLKRDFEIFCEDKGLTMSTAMNVFARQAVREDRIPFEIKGDQPNAETLAAFKEVEDMESGKIESKTYSLQEFIDEVLEDDSGR